MDAGEVERRTPFSTYMVRASNVLPLNQRPLSNAMRVCEAAGAARIKCVNNNANATRMKISEDKKAGGHPYDM
jgi:hypothetical protein